MHSLPFEEKEKEQLLATTFVARYALVEAMTTEIEGIEEETTVTATAVATTTTAAADAAATNATTATSPTTEVQPPLVCTTSYKRHKSCCY